MHDNVLLNYVWKRQIETAFHLKILFLNNNFIIGYF